MLAIFHFAPKFQLREKDVNVQCRELHFEEKGKIGKSR